MTVAIPHEARARTRLALHGAQRERRLYKLLPNGLNVSHRWRDALNCRDGAQLALGERFARHATLPPLQRRRLRQFCHQVALF
eukprot:6619981-Prymnesium_polylepis.2